MSRIEAKRAELELLEAEEAFHQKKLDGTATTEDKVAIRELRRAYRENYRQPTTEGAAPAAIGAKGKVNL